jgi:hypothetical protein
MVQREVPLCRLEQLLLGVANELRPTLAVGDPAVMFDPGPYRKVNIVVGIGALCLGSAARYLGQLALTMGNGAEAVEHFEQALVSNSSLKSPLWLAHAQLDYAAAVAPSATAEMLIDAAESTARELELPLVARRGRELRGN